MKMIKEIRNVFDVHYLLGAFKGTIEGVLIRTDIPDDLKSGLQERLKELNEIKIILSKPIQLKNLKNPE